VGVALLRLKQIEKELIGMDFGTDLEIIEDDEHG